MGIYCDFVIADAGMGERVLDGADPHWPSLELKGVDPINLSILYRLVEPTKTLDEVMDSFELVGETEGDEGEDEDEDDEEMDFDPEVFIMPVELLQALSRISGDEAKTLAQKWALTEEMQRDRWAAADAETVIRQLSDHARKAVTTGKTMYMAITY